MPRRVLLVGLAGVALLPLAASAQGPDSYTEQGTGSYDELHSRTLLYDARGAASSEKRLTIDTSTYTMSNPETRGAGEDPTCSGGEIHYGGKSGWVTFRSRVSGTALVGWTTPFDGMLSAWRGQDPGLVSPAYNQLQNLNCSSGQPAGGTEGFNFIPVPKDEPVYIQVMGFCAKKSSGGGDVRSTCSNYNGPPSQSGVGALSITFYPTDTDKDGVADSYDLCPGAEPPPPVGARTDYDQDGCTDPNPDKDEVPNVQGRDKCVRDAGPAPDGCPRRAAKLRLSFLVGGDDRRTYALFAQLNAEVNRGATLTLSCRRAGGRTNCPRIGPKRIRRSGTVRLGRAFKGRKIPPGTSVSVTVTQRHFLGQTGTTTVRRASSGPRVTPTRYRCFRRGEPSNTRRCP